MRKNKFIHVVSTFKPLFSLQPLHLVLLPIFFILTTYSRYSGLLYPSEFLLPFIKITALAFIYFFLLYMLLKNKTKAGILATLFILIFLFFGEFKIWLQDLPLVGIIASYRFLLPLLLLLYTFIFLRIIKSKSLVILTTFLNTLFSFFIIIEIWKISAQQSIKPVSPQIAIDNKVTNTLRNLPDIYYIVPDCYPSSAFQKEALGSSFNFLDSALLDRNFYVLNNSTSNFHLTSFSVAATLNMQYSNWIQKNTPTIPADYSNSVDLIKYAAIPKSLKSLGYKIYNLSVFEIANQSPIGKARLISKTADQIIFYNTLWMALKWQVIPSIFPSYVKKLESINMRNNRSLRNNFKRYNQTIIDSLKSSHFTPVLNSPKFIYAHLEMPHYPYYFDSTGNPYSDEEVFKANSSLDKNKFKGYIGYTNKIILTIIDSLLYNSNKKCVIIIQSDHGTGKFQPGNDKDAFSNYSAFYFPDSNYKGLYDSMSNVNTFRIILNKYFGQRLNMLKDTSIYLKH